MDVSLSAKSDTSISVLGCKCVHYLQVDKIHAAAGRSIQETKYFSEIINYSHIIFCPFTGLSMYAIYFAVDKIKREKKSIQWRFSQ